MKKRMIFHLPFKIDLNRHSGSMIRPRMMIEAFKNLGYEVKLIEGYIENRKKAIGEIKENINNGILYDFVYSESSTMPTALTEKNHLPVAPFLDFDFLAFCKTKDIPVGLFYRDVYWMYPDLYNDGVPFIKRVVSKFFYRFDLRQYEKVVSTLFLPSIRMAKCISKYKLKAHALPPALDKIQEVNLKNQDSKTLNFFYIGGVSKVYDFTHLISAIGRNNKTTLTICTRIDDWNENKDFLQPFLKDNITVVHKSGKDLIDLYSDAHICISSFKHHDYWDFAMGVKNFEYISFSKPIIGTKDTAIGDFIDDNNIGWVIQDNKDDAQALINRLITSHDEINIKMENLKLIQNRNMWKDRAAEVAAVLELNDLI